MGRIKGDFDKFPWICTGIYNSVTLLGAAATSLGAFLKEHRDVLKS